MSFSDSVLMLLHRNDDNIRRTYFKGPDVILWQCFNAVTSK